MFNQLCEDDSIGLGWKQQGMTNGSREERKGDGRTGTSIRTHLEQHIGEVDVVAIGHGHYIDNLHLLKHTMFYLIILCPLLLVHSATIESINKTNYEPSREALIPGALGTVSLNVPNYLRFDVRNQVHNVHPLSALFGHYTSKLHSAALVQPMVSSSAAISPYWVASSSPMPPIALGRPCDQLVLSDTRYQACRSSEASGWLYNVHGSGGGVTPSSMLSYSDAADSARVCCHLWSALECQELAVHYRCEPSAWHFFRMQVGDMQTQLESSSINGVCYYYPRRGWRCAWHSWGWITALVLGIVIVFVLGLLLVFFIVRRQRALKTADDDQSSHTQARRQFVRSPSSVRANRIHRVHMAQEEDEDEEMAANEEGEGGNIRWQQRPRPGGIRPVSAI